MRHRIELHGTVCILATFAGVAVVAVAIRVAPTWLVLTAAGLLGIGLATVNRRLARHAARGCRGVTR